MSATHPPAGAQIPTTGHSGPTPMTEVATTLPSRLRDLAALGKPRLSGTVLMTAAGGLYLAPGSIGPWLAMVSLTMTAMAVWAANSLNCYLERHSDRLMKRTRTRPLPAGRLDARVALWMGLGASVVSVAVLSWALNPLSGALAAAAIVSYVAMYTPMKRRSPHALYVGAIPGAIPPLLGWVSVTGRMDAGGLALFAVLFVWQLPHFLAIALYLREDYQRAGIRVLPLVDGSDRRTRLLMVGYTAALIPVTLTLVPLGVAGMRFLVGAVGLGVAFVIWSVRGLQSEAGPRWARKMMLASIVYLVLLFAALAVDVIR